MAWQQVFNPLNNMALSTILAALPIVALLGTLAFLRMKAHWSAISGLIASFVSAIVVFGMAHQNGRNYGSVRSLFRAHAHWLDHPQRYLSVSADQTQRAV